MDREQVTEGSHIADSGDYYLTSQQSLRLRRIPSPASENVPNFSWNSSANEDDRGETQPSREVRSLPMPMALKRAIWQVQKMHVPVYSWKSSKGKSLLRLKESTREFLAFFTLWRKSMHKIAGNFGGGVQSYFLFLRFLVILNFLSFLLIAGFVLIPSIVFRSVRTSPANISGPENCTLYDPNPQGLVMFYRYFLDLLTGTGFMEYSYLFYGYYNNTIVQDSNRFYNIPLAYLLTTVFYFAFCLICIIVRMGTATRVAVATEGGAAGNYSKIVFTGWDYGCLGDRATKLKQKNICYQLQVDLEEEMMKRRTDSLTLGQKIFLFSQRTFLAVVAFGLNIAAFYGIFEATVFSQNSSKEGVLGLLLEYLPSMVITAGNFVVPFLCDQIALFEKYNSSTTVIVALLRSVFLRMVSLGVLLFTLWSKITCSGNLNNVNCTLCQYSYKEYPCWETRVGQEMYKLTLFDFLITLTVLILVEFPRRMVVDNSSMKLVQLVGRQEFVVPSNVLGLVYGQTVIWTGALFCPLLPLINTIKFFILFYFKKITLFTNCRPAMKTFRSTKSTFFFLVVLLFGWSLALVVMIYSVAVMHPSMSCGPFRDFPAMWKIVPTSFHNLSKSTQDFLFYIGSQAFSIPLFLFFCVVMCYFIALASVYGKSVEMLRGQIKLESRDKQFLVKQIEEMSRKLVIPKD